jgi:hypothetical protein
MARLLNNVSVDTDGIPQPGDGGSKQISIWGADYGGGSVTIQTSPDLITWITLKYGGNPAVFTSNISLKLDKIGQGFYIRATLTGSSGASGVNVDMAQ